MTVLDTGQLSGVLLPPLTLICCVLIHCSDWITDRHPTQSLFLFFIIEHSRECVVGSSIRGWSERCVKALNYFDGVIKERIKPSQIHNRNLLQECLE